ncbi:MAG: RiPP maturation radical SAM C-methyltransferase [Elusimicrobiota bacterium]
MKVALVTMPWLNTEHPPLGVAALKSYLAAQGIAADCWHLQLLMAERVGPNFLSTMSDMLWPSWFFAYHLFGPGGTRELDAGLDDVFQVESFRNFASASRLSRERAETLLREDIPAFMEDCLTKVPWGDYGLIGFSDIMASQLACLALAKELKARYPKIPIVFGGSNLEGPMGLATLKGCDWIDYLVDGEGEKALTALALNLRDGKPHEPVPKTLARRGTRVLPAVAAAPLDMNELPTPDHDDFFRQRRLYPSLVARAPEPAATFEGSRGCWWGQTQHCTFCGIPGNVMAFREKDSELVARDVIELHRKYKTRRMIAADVIVGRDHMTTLLPKLAEFRRLHRLDWEFFFEIKANLTEEQIKSCIDAGITEYQPGIESFSSDVLRRMRKGLRAIQGLQTLKLSRTHGILVNWIWVYGIPGEDPAEYERMPDIILSATHLMPPRFVNRIRVERFSPYHRSPAEFGITLKPYVQYEYCYPRPRFDLEEVAHFFDHWLPKGAADPEVYTAGLQEAIRFWEEVHRTSFFAYTRGLGFLELYDCRPLALRNPSRQFTRHRLEGVEAAIMDLCETIHDFPAIVRACREHDAGCSEERVRESLAAMTARRWLHREEDSYLALAVPVSSLIASQRVALEQLLQTKKELYYSRASEVGLA